MSEERYREIDDLLSQFGWAYNPVSREFESDNPDDEDNSLTMDGKELLAMLPGVSEDELAEYVERVDQASNA